MKKRGDDDMKNFTKILVSIVMLLVTISLPAMQKEQKCARVIGGPDGLLGKIVRIDGTLKELHKEGLFILSEKSPSIIPALCYYLRLINYCTDLPVIKRAVDTYSEVYTDPGAVYCCYGEKDTLCYFLHESWLEPISLVDAQKGSFCHAAVENKKTEGGTQYDSFWQGSIK
jgi:hypothetical protein